MKLSVVIPCRNAASSLGQTIGSVLEQTRLPDEIVVVDDASEDGSVDVARRFRGRVRLVRAGFRSAPRNRRRGPGSVPLILVARPRRPSMGMSTCPMVRSIGPVLPSRMSGRRPVGAPTGQVASRPGVPRNERVEPGQRAQCDAGPQKRPAANTVCYDGFSNHV